MATALAAAAAAAAECVGPRPSLGTAGPSHQCRNRVFRVQLAVLPYSRRVAASAAAPAAAARAETEFVPGAWSSAARASTKSGQRTWRWQAVAEQLQAEMEETSETAFPSDSISVFFEAEGSLPDSSVSKLTSTLEGLEGVSDVHVTATSDGTASVKLTKQMNVQATGVASGLVEVLLAGGFKLQALNLGFDEDDGDDDQFYGYDLSSSTEDTEALE